MAILARQHFSRMRGGSQAHLMLGEDSHYYIVKFQNNPQHRRVLANEWVAYTLLAELGLPVPAGEIVEVPFQLIAECPELRIQRGDQIEPCSPGLQFGSRYPGDPSRLTVYDYIPDILLRQVVNVDSFLGMVAFDKWVSNANGRQAIFFRDQTARWMPRAASESPRGPGFVAVMIDHGFIFMAQQWSFRDLPQVGIYPRPWLYEGVAGYESFEPWLGRIRHCSPAVLDKAFRSIPPEWLNGDLEELERLLEELYQRRSRVPDLVRGAKQLARDPFPNWM